MAFFESILHLVARASESRENTSLDAVVLEEHTISLAPGTIFRDCYHPRVYVGREAHDITDSPADTRPFGRTVVPLHVTCTIEAPRFVVVADTITCTFIRTFKTRESEARLRNALGAQNLQLVVHLPRRGDGVWHAHCHESFEIHGPFGQVPLVP